MVTPGRTPSEADFVAGLADGLVSGALPARDLMSSGRLSSISSELADTIVSRLFEVGLVLQSADADVDGPARLRLRQAADELDALIRDVRSAVFGPAD